MWTSSRTRSASTDVKTVVLALGSNLGDREYNLRRAVWSLRSVVRVVRMSRMHRTAPVDAPPGSPDFLNMVIAGYTWLAPEALMAALLDIEARLGRVRTGVRNAPRVIDLDLIFYDAVRRNSRFLTLPHPRWHERRFVTEPLRELRLAFV